VSEGFDLRHGPLNLKSDHDFEEGKLVPIVHVLFTLNATVLEPWNMGALRNALPEQNKDIRAELIKWIADEGLGGDISAATWLLLVVLGRVSVSSNVLWKIAESFYRQSRSPPILPLSLTISSFPDAPQETLSSPAITWVLKELLSTLTVVPLSLEGINGKSFAPNSTDDDLHAGLLQQAPGTTTMVTETGIKEGKVTESGM
jgi:Mini-chromosome maintenance replisome factor